MKVYIQALNGFPIDDWAVSAYMGFRDRQMDCYFFEDLAEVPISKEVVLVGSIENSNAYLESLGLPPKQALNIPLELMDYAKREITYMTLGEFKTMVRDGDMEMPVFIKPNGKAKAFTAGVMRNESTITWAFEGISNECPVLICDEIDIVSEYRGYVINKELKGIKHYLGDFRVFPDMKIVDAAIKDYKSAPVGYSIDFGITKEGETILIECNDGFSLGNYGLDNSIYTSLLLRRWLEMVK